MGRQDRTRCAADAPRGHVQQPRQRQHQRLQERPRGVRRPAVPERPPGRQLDLAGHRGALGRAPGHRRARGGHRKALHAGRSHADRQRAGRGHRRPRLLPDPVARWHQRLHARRQLPAVVRGPDGDLERLHPAARHQHSRRLAEHQHRPRRHRQRATGRPGRAGAGGPAAAHRLRESGRPAAAGRKPAGGNRGQRSGADAARRARTASASPRRARSKPRTSTWSKSWST